MDIYDKDADDKRGPPTIKGRRLKLADYDHSEIIINNEIVLYSG